jgi:hypothetical protein
MAEEEERLEKYRRFTEYNRESCRSTQDMIPPSNKSLVTLNRIWYAAFKQDAPKVETQGECGRSLRFALETLKRRKECQDG